MKTFVLLFAASVLCFGQVNPHPRIYLTAEKIEAVRNKIINNDPVWAGVKNSINGAKLTACRAYPMTTSVAEGDMVNFALAYVVASRMSPSERSEHGLTNYLEWARCAIQLATAQMSRQTGNRAFEQNGDGVTRDFTLANPIQYRPLVIEVRSAADDSLLASYGGAAIGRHGIDSGKVWYWEKESAQIRMDAGQTPLTASQKLRVVYDGEPYACVGGETAQAMNPAGGNNRYAFRSSSTGALTYPDYIPCPVSASDTAAYSFATYLNDFRNHAGRPAVVFDWAYPELSAEEKQFFVGWMRAAAWYAARSERNNYKPYLFKQGQGPGGNYGAGSTSRLGLLGLALHGDDPSDSGDTNDPINWMLGWVRGYHAPYYTGLNAYPDYSKCAFCPQDGAPSTADPDVNPSGFGKGGMGAEGSYSGITEMYLLELNRAMTTASAASGATFEGEVPDFVEELYKWLLHSATPAETTTGRYTTYQFLLYGDTDNPVDLVPSEWRGVTVLLLADYFGDTEKGRHCRFFFDQTQPAAPPYWHLSWAWLLYHDKNWAKQDYRAVEPKHYFAPGHGTVLSRSGWDGTSTWVTFMAGPRFTNHQHEDNGHFNIWRKGFWLAYESHGYMTSIFPQRIVHSVLTHQKSGETIAKGTPTFKALGVAQVDRYSAHPDGLYVYARADMTRGYRAKPGAVASTTEDYLNVQHYTRDFVHFQPDHVVVLDRFQYAGETSSVTRVNALQTLDGPPPTMGGNAVTIPVAGQTLHVTTLSPEEPSIRLVNLAKRQEWRNHNGNLRNNEWGIVRANGVRPDDTSIPMELFRSTDSPWFPNVMWINDAEMVRACSYLKTSTQLAITALSGAGVSPIRVTTASHSLVSGDYVTISGVTGNSAANGTFRVTRVSSTEFSLDETAGSGNWAGGGSVTNRNNIRICQDVAGGRGYGGTTAGAHGGGVPVSGWFHTWQVQNTLTTPANTFGQALQVIQASDTGVDADPATRIQNISPSFLGLVIGGQQQSLLYLAPKTSATHTSVTFTPSYSGTGRVLVTGLQPGTYEVQYNGGTIPEYAAVEVNAQGSLYFEAPAGAFSVNRLGGATAPEAPAQMKASSTSSSSIELSWMDNSSDETQFRVERSTDGGQVFVFLALRGANEVFHSDSGLAASSQYCYRVRAEGSAGESAWSNVACATTPTGSAGVSVTTASPLPDGRVGLPYTIDPTFDASGGIAPYQWSVPSGSIPPGLSLSLNSLVGTPSVSGNYTFTIRVQDASSGTAEREFQLAIAAEPTHTVDVSAQLSSSEGVITYGYPGLSANQPCQVQISDDQLGQNIVYQSADSGGPARRHTVIPQSLSASTTYWLSVTCGPQDTEEQVTTPPGASGTSSLLVRLRPPDHRGIARLRLEHGSSETLGEESIVDCAAGCQVEVPGLRRGAIHFLRHTWLDAGSTPLAQSRILPVLLR